MYLTQNLSNAALVAATLLASQVVVSAGGFTTAVGQAVDRLGSAAVDALADTGSSLASKHRNEGGNKFHGNIAIDSKVRAARSIRSENYSEVLVGAARFAKSEVGGNVNIKTDAQVGGDITARNASTIVAASADVRDSKISGRFDANMVLRVGGSITAENGSYINAGSIRMNGTSVGGNVAFRSNVAIGGDLTARNLGTIIVGGAEL